MNKCYHCKRKRKHKFQICHWYVTWTSVFTFFFIDKNERNYKRHVD